MSAQGALAGAAVPLAAGTAIRRESAISTAVNTIFSLVFFLLIFGTHGPVAVWGAGNYAFDLIPQFFMISLMATLVPGAILGRRYRRGLVEGIATPSRLPKRRWLRALVLALAAVAAAVLIGWPLLWLSGLTAIGWTPALIAKLVLGATLAAIVTPLGLRAELDPR